MNRPTIDAGDVVEIESTKRQMGKARHELELKEVVQTYPDGRLQVEREDKRHTFNATDVKRHWKPAKPEGRKRGPLAGPRKRDKLVITAIEMELCRPNPRARLKAKARIQISDQLWISEVMVLDDTDVWLPEHVRLCVPKGKTWLKWRNAIVLEYMKLTGAKA